MKEHFCPIEKEWIGYEGQCNWCGEKELVRKREWIGLTDREFIELWANTGPSYPITVFGKAIEAKLKDKNT